MISIHQHKIELLITISAYIVVSRLIRLFDDYTKQPSQQYSNGSQAQQSLEEVWWRASVKKCNQSFKNAKLN